MPKAKKEDAGSLRKSEHQKLQRLYTQGGAVYGSVRILVKTNNLPKLWVESETIFTIRDIVPKNSFGHTKLQEI